MGGAVMFVVVGLRVGDLAVPLGCFTLLPSGLLEELLLRLKRPMSVWGRDCCREGLQDYGVWLTDI